ncbi:MAG: NAD-glutamate dehydrogenase [Candidatus Aminicenantes bacterium]|nr:NAD-glutamate dehydrogenase [Candidatus Aminicenantes bacterium]
MKTLQEISCKSVLNEAQIRKIEELILAHGRYTQTAVREELNWYCAGMAMNAFYFKTTPVETVAKHIEALMAAEILATVKQEKIVKIDFETEHADEAIYMVDDYHYRALEIEHRIEERYPDYRLQCYRTSRKAAGLEYLRMYVVTRPVYPMESGLADETDIHKLADKSFLASVPEETLQRFQKLVKEHRGWESPLFDISLDHKTKELRLMIIVNRDSCRRFFSNISDVLNSHGLVSNRKYIEQLANGKTIVSIYLDNIADERLIQEIVEDISQVYAIPESALSQLFREGKLNAQEMVFGVSAWSFSHQFLSGFNEEYLKLSAAMKDSPELLGILRTMKTKLVKDTYQESRVWDALCVNPLYIKKAFTLFDKKFNPSRKNHAVDAEIADLKKDILRNIPIDIDRNIFLMVCLFIETTLRTNFYIKEKTSLTYMYDPKFLDKVDYPETPFGIFHVVGAEFRGFHIRFRDIARGGIRIVKSPNLQTYLNNSDLIFDENYNLAWTQQRKNKDLPEGGSKGTILLNWGYMDKAHACFKKYVDGLLDLILPNAAIVDTYGKPVILFLGPDEWTADLMEWAAQRGRQRGYAFWRAFSTGKPVTMGGIPHDLYGMTTNSIHQFVLGSLDKLGLKEAAITKVMTGGPDGDLGSNEILISKDRILAIVDGSGVLYDPESLNRKELVKLARARKMVEAFPKEKLSTGGFLVNVKDRDITLPHGEKVENGLEFRNMFHLHPLFKADIFVPCGGRPASITINNWTTYLNDGGEPRFKVIVEGANLFITQQARLRLEEKGVVLYKDASANKGGVTSSSLEVLAGLALTDKEFEELMCVKNGILTGFRKTYIDEIIQSVKDNADQEFEIIWKENKAKGIPRAVLTDVVSEKINQIKDAIAASGLFTSKVLVKKVIAKGAPPVLVEKIGVDKILKRLPEAYQKALFASRLAGAYVYKHGLDADEIDFFEFIKGI